MGLPYIEITKAKRKHPLPKMNLYMKGVGRVGVLVVWG
jgi:hypothetical protein